MSTGRKMPLAEAQELANKIVGWLESACERIEVAGSIRRKKAEVGDIEVVCIPKRSTELFGGEGDSLLDKRLHELCWENDGTFMPLKAGGDKYKKYEVSTYTKGGYKFLHANLDLFIATPETWGCIFTIRTGPADFSHRLVTARQQGGLCPSFMRFKEGRIWHGDKPLNTPEERNVFDACGIPWTEPEARQ